MIKHKFNLVIIITVIHLVSFGQFKFQKTYGGSGTEGENCWLIGGYSARTEICANGDYVFSGVTTSFKTNLNYNAYFFKLAKNGDTLYTKTFYTDSAHTQGVNSFETSDKKRLYGISLIPFSGGTLADGGAVIIKTDSLGNIIFSKRFYTPGNLNVLSSFIQLKNKEYLLSGYTIPGYFFFFIKLDSLGNTVFTRTSQNFGTSRIYASYETYNGDLIFTGYAENSIGEEEALLIRLDKSGSIKWAKRYNTGIPFMMINGVSICEDFNKDIIIAGHQLNNTSDLFLLKTDSISTLKHAKLSADSLIKAFTSVICKNNQLFLTGFLDIYNGGYQKYPFLAKADSNTNIIWTKLYKSSMGRNTSIKPTTDNGFIISGLTLQGSSTDIQIIKTDSSGNTNCPIDTVTLNFISIPATTSSQTITMNNTIISSTLLLNSGNGCLIGTYCFQEDFTSINEMSQKEHFKIYPNPIENDLIINFEKQSDIVLVKIYDLLGRVMFENKYINQEIAKIDLSNLSKAVYLIEINSGSFKLVKKLFKQ